MSPFSKALVFVTAAFISLPYAANPPTWDAELIFDDFDDVYGDPTNRTCLGAVKSYSESGGSFTKGKFGYWYTFSGNGGTIAGPSGIELTSSNIKDAFDTEEKCMHVTFDAEDDESYAAIAANLFSEGDWVDLTKMTGLSVKVKGTGSIRFYFKSKYFQVQDYAWGDIGYSVDLTESWKTINVDIDDLLPAPWSPAEEDGVMWDDCKDAITSFAIEITTNTDAEEKIATDAWIDEIIFKGMKYSDIVDTNVTGIVCTPAGVHNSVQPFSVTGNTISYSIEQPQNISFSILNLNGTVAGNISGITSTGSHQCILPVLPAGTYLVKMNSGKRVASQRLTILK